MEYGTLKTTMIDAEASASEKLKESLDDCQSPPRIHPPRSSCTAISRNARNIRNLYSSISTPRISASMDR